MAKFRAEIWQAVLVANRRGERCLHQIRMMLDERRAVRNPLRAPRAKRTRRLSPQLNVLLHQSLKRQVWEEILEMGTLKQVEG